MHHLVAYSESLGQVTDSDVNGLSDQVMSLRNNHITPGADVDLIAALAMQSNLTRVRIETPRLLALTRPYVYPAERAATPVYNQVLMDLRQRPLRLSGAEEIALQATTDAVGPAQFYGLLWLRRQFAPAPQGEIFTVYGTSTTAATANAWSDITMTWNFQLPAGLYAIIGGHYYAATAVAFRCLLEGQTFRPGGLGFATEPRISWTGQMDGGLGLWGTFDTITLPQIQVLNGAAVAAHTIILQVVRIR